MHLDRRHRRRLRWQNIVFVLLLLGLLGMLVWLAQFARVTADWSQTHRNTLTPTSRQVLQLLDQPVSMTAYIGPKPVVRRRIRHLIERYRRAGADIQLQFVNPETDPALARELGIRRGGELIVHYGERQQRMQRISEQRITRALARLTRSGERWVVFLQGHGERDPNGDANFDLGRFGQRLQQRGFRVQTLQLAQMPHIPDNTDLLILASPQSNYLPGERAQVRTYLRSGGHLLWLTEPGTRDNLRALADELGVHRLNGVVVDADAKLVGADKPDFAVVSQYGKHPLTQGLDQLSLFPQAAALTSTAGGGWQHRALLHTRAQSWTETGPIAGRIGFDRAEGETHGPLTLGIAARRGPPAEGSEPARGGQRIAVIGDGDFLSNAYLGNGANLDLGMRLVNWLVGDSARVQIPPETTPDARVSLSRTGITIMAFGFLLALPLALLLTGLFIVWRRRGR